MVKELEIKRSFCQTASESSRENTLLSNHLLSQDFVFDYEDYHSLSLMKTAKQIINWLILVLVVL
jgi:hypothetical protein